MADKDDKNAGEIEMLRSKLTVLEKGRHDDPSCDADIKECQERIRELEAKEKGSDV